MILALGVFAGVAGTGWAFWSALSNGGSNGSSGAAGVNQGNTPTASVAGQTVTITWTASTLTTGQAVDGYLVKRYDAVTPFAVQTILSTCTGTITALTCDENSVPTGSWQYTVIPKFATNWQGVESPKSSAVSVSGGETTPPVNAITLSGVSGGAFKNGDTVYYAGTVAGSFTLTNAVTDADSGPASSATATLTGTTTGWTHTPSLVSTPSGGPYVSNAFAWGNATTSSPSEVVTGRDVVGNTAGTTLTFVDDSTAPTTGTVTYTDGSVATSTLSVSFTTGTDGGSGIGTRLLQRASATLTNGVCGATYSSFTTVTNGTNPTSPVVDAVSGGACYKYQYLVWDNVGNAATAATSASVAKVTTYAALVGGTPGLVSYHRLGESAGGTGAVVSDSFTGTDGTLLTAHAPDLGATWLHQTGSSYMVVSNGRTRRNTGANSALSVDYVPTQPSTVNYSVSADIYNASHVSGDRVGVIARLNTSSSAFYVARWEQPNTDWFITKYTSGTSFSTLAETNANTALVVGATYNVRLEVTGTNPTTLKLYVNGVLKLTANDGTSPLTAIGYAGVIDGHTAGQDPKTDTTGKLLDNFLVTEAPDPAAIDSKGTNLGYYMGYITAGVTGAISGDANTAASFDGVNDYVNVGCPISDDFSIEFWFKSTQGIGTGTHWSQGAGLVNTDSSGAIAATATDFGVSLRSDGRVVAGVGDVAGGTSIVSTTGGYNVGGGWHHVVFTRVKATGAMALYIDGSAQGTATGSTVSLNVRPVISIGRLATPGSYFAGSIDEVALYTAALDATTITEHYNAGV